MKEYTEPFREYMEDVEYKLESAIAWDSGIDVHDLYHIAIAQHRLNICLVSYIEVLAERVAEHEVKANWDGVIGPSQKQKHEKWNESAKRSAEQIVGKFRDE